MPDAEVERLYSADLPGCPGAGKLEIVNPLQEPG
jgi:hypothetical protein